MHDQVSCHASPFSHMQIPRTCQCLLMSATTSEDVQRLQKLVLHNPTVIDCTDQGAEANDLAGSNAAGTSSQVQHFSVQRDRLGTRVHCVAMLPQACQVMHSTVFGIHLTTMWDGHRTLGQAAAAPKRGSFAHCCGVAEAGLVPSTPCSNSINGSCLKCLSPTATLILVSFCAGKTSCCM